MDKILIGFVIGVILMNMIATWFFTTWQSLKKKQEELNHLKTQLELSEQTVDLSRNSPYFEGTNNAKMMHQTIYEKAQKDYKELCKTPSYALPSKILNLRLAE